MRRDLLKGSQLNKKSRQRVLLVLSLTVVVGCLVREAIEHGRSTKMGKSLDLVRAAAVLSGIR